MTYVELFHSVISRCWNWIHCSWNNRGILVGEFS